MVARVNDPAIGGPLDALHAIEPAGADLPGVIGRVGRAYPEAARKGLLHGSDDAAVRGYRRRPGRGQIVREPAHSAARIGDDPELDWRAGLVPCCEKQPAAIGEPAKIKYFGPAPPWHGLFLTCNNVNLDESVILSAGIGILNKRRNTLAIR